MQVVVKNPRIRVEGEVTRDLVDYLRRQFGETEVIENVNEELVEVRQSDWYRKIRPTIQPGENVRIYRKMHNLTQRELGNRLGNVTRQNISNIENGQRPISKAIAKRLADVFDVSVEKFL